MLKMRPVTDTTLSQCGNECKLIIKIMEGKGMIKKRIMGYSSTVVPGSTFVADFERITGNFFASFKHFSLTY